MAAVGVKGLMTKRPQFWNSSFVSSSVV